MLDQLRMIEGCDSPVGEMVAMFAEEVVSVVSVIVVEKMKDEEASRQQRVWDAS